MLVERLLAFYVNSQNVKRLIPESDADSIRALLSDAMKDPQISGFVSLSFQSLAETVLTFALARGAGYDFARQSGQKTRKRVKAWRSTTQWRAFHDILLHQPDRVADLVDVTGAVRGLASLHYTLEQYKPDMVVAVDGGGEMIAQFLCKRVGVTPSHYFVARLSGSTFKLDRPVSAATKPQRLVIIDDISRSGETLARVREAALAAMNTKDVRVMSLVASAAATDRLKGEFLIVAFVSPSMNVTIPWDTTGSYASKPGAYIFGSRASQLRIPKMFYDQVYKDVASGGR